MAGWVGLLFCLPSWPEPPLFLFLAMVVGSLLVPSSILVNNLGGVNGLGKVGGCVHDIIFAALRTSFPTPNNFYCHETGCKHRMMAQNCLQTALARGPINTTRYRRPMVANGPFGWWVGRARVCDGGLRRVASGRSSLDQPRKGTRWQNDEGWSTPMEAQYNGCIANGRNYHFAIDTARAAHRHVALDLMVVARPSSPVLAGKLSLYFYFTK